MHEAVYRQKVDESRNTELVYHNSKSVTEIRLDSLLGWYDTLKEGSDPKIQESYIETLSKYLSKKEKVSLYGDLRAIAAAYKIIGNYQEWDRHLEAAELTRRKFKLKIPQNNPHTEKNDLANKL